MTFGKVRTHPQWEMCTCMKVLGKKMSNKAWLSFINRCVSVQHSLKWDSLCLNCIHVVSKFSKSMNYSPFIFVWLKKSNIVSKSMKFKIYYIYHFNSSYFSYTFEAVFKSLFHTYSWLGLFICLAIQNCFTFWVCFPMKLRIAVLNFCKENIVNCKKRCLMQEKFLWYIKNNYATLKLLNFWIMS